MTDKDDEPIRRGAALDFLREHTSHDYQLDFLCEGIAALPAVLPVVTVNTISQSDSKVIE